MPEQKLNSDVQPIVNSSAHIAAMPLLPAGMGSLKEVKFKTYWCIGNQIQL